MARNVVQNFTRENRPVETRNYEQEAKKIIQNLKNDVSKIRTHVQNLKREEIRQEALKREQEEARKRQQETIKREQEQVLRRQEEARKRELPPPKLSPPQLTTQIRDYTSSPDYNYYLGFGGLGDALLLLAECWDDTKAKVVFFANSPPLFVGSFFNLFGRSIFLHDNIMGTSVAGTIYDYMVALPTFKQSAHLADGLNFGDWANETKYIPRIKNSAPWIAHLGKENYDKKVLILAPSGSNKENNRQRYITPDEYRALANKYLAQDYQIFSVGSIADFHYYGIVNHPNFNWLNSEIIYSSTGARATNLLKMLQIINSADMVISADTFLKTYTLLCGIPTVVIKTRWNGRYRTYGEDVTDWIFLNPNIWPNIKIEPIENLL
jgi:hypothetical protein